MEIRRPVAALFLALTLAGGGLGALTGCGDPSGGATSDNRNDGTPDDDSKNTSGNDPSGVSQGNVPDNDDSEEGGGDNESDN
jgi:hypothetical protein